MLVSQSFILPSAQQMDIARDAQLLNSSADHCLAFTMLKKKVQMEACYFHKKRKKKNDPIHLFFFMSFQEVHITSSPLHPLSSCSWHLYWGPAPGLQYHCEGPIECCHQQPAEGNIRMANKGCHQDLVKTKYKARPYNQLND